MDKVASFEVDHTQLQPGVYVSRTDAVGNTVVTTFDVRLTAPYREEPLSPAVLHTLEHLVAVYLREKSDWAGRILYWGPMGCQTGFDFLVIGEVSAAEIVPLLRVAFEFVAKFDGVIPGAEHAYQCGNYKLHDLKGAKEVAHRFATLLACWKENQSEYPARKAD